MSIHRPLVQRASMPLFHSGDRRLESDTGDLAGVAKQVDAPRPERDALRRTAGSNPAAGTASPSRRSSAQARALTWYVRGRAFDSRRRLQFTKTSGCGEIGSRNRLKSGRVRRLVHVRVVRSGPYTTGSGVGRRPAGLPNRWCGIVARLPVHAEVAHKVEQRRCISQAPVRVWLSAPRNMPG